MARVNVYIPDELRERAMALDDLNLSRIFRNALEEALELRAECDHKRVSCVACSAEMPGPSAATETRTAAT